MIKRRIFVEPTQKERKMIKRRTFIGIALMGLPALAAPVDPLERYRQQLPPNYGSGAVFRVKTHVEGGRTILTGRVLTAQDRTALAALYSGPVDNRLAFFPYAEQAPKNYGLILASRVDMRAEASNTSELVSQAVQGDTLLILDQRLGWYEIMRLWDGYVGWVPQIAVEALDRATLQARLAQPRVMVLADQGGYFAGAVLAEPPPGIPTRPLLAPIPNFRDQVVFYAQEFLARSRKDRFPYLWGGTYGRALDCSGFNQTVFRLAGVALPRDSYQQQAFGQKIAATPKNLDLLQPGDLVFFSENGRRATHTGIYVGKGMMIHASGGKGNAGLGQNDLRADQPYELFLRKIWWGAARITPQVADSQGLYSADYPV